MYYYFQRSTSIMGENFNLRRLDALEGKSNRQEYIETFKELVGEEEISARLRRMLDREAETLCITKERQEEIENSIKINR